MAMELETERRNRMAQPTEDELEGFMSQQFPDEPEAGGDLWTRLAKVQRDLRAPKGQHNDFGNYDYRSAEDILEAVKPLLARERLAMTIADTLESIGDRYYVKATVAVVALDTPQMTQVTAYAREEETKKGMDASQITGSASSYARKYALNGMFLIDDTKDADTNEHRRQRERPEQGNEPDKWGPGTGGGPIDQGDVPPLRQQAERPAQVQSPQTAQNAQHRPNTQATGDFDKPLPPSGGRPASERQVNAVFAIAKRAGANPEEWAIEAGADGTDGLSSQQASWLIEKYGGPR